MTVIPTPICVAAAALIGKCGRVLMHRRRFGAQHGGLWEFPGGKIEPGETPQSALVRELREELGIAVTADCLIRAGFADRSDLPPGEDSGVGIHLYTCFQWHGEVQCLEGEAIDWFELADIRALAMPPLDYPLAAQLEAHLAGLAK